MEEGRKEVKEGERGTLEVQLSQSFTHVECFKDSLQSSSRIQVS